MADAPVGARWAGPLLGLSLAAVFLLALEGVAQLVWEPGRLEGILAILEQHPELMWRQRAGLETRFEGEPLLTDALGLRTTASGPPDDWEQTSPRVLVLGGSPTLGWGVAGEQAYAAQLEELLRTGSAPGARVRNAGQVGWSSHQGRRFMEDGAAGLEADVVTIAYAINDVDSYRFFRSDGRPDRALEPGPAVLIAVRNRLERLALFRLMDRGLPQGRGGLALEGAGGLAVFRPGSPRVSLEDYRDNLSAMVAQVRSSGAWPLLVVMPVHLPDGPQVPEPDAERARTHQAEAVHRLDAGECDKAVGEASTAVALDPLASQAHYVLAVCSDAAGDLDASGTHLEAAMEAEGHRCSRDGKRYNQAMRQLAAELGVRVVDAAAALAPMGDAAFVDPVTDPIHPSPAGHALIARLIAQQLTTPTEGETASGPARIFSSP